MGKCNYCGEKAGFFKSKHKECEQKYHNGISEIVNEVENTIVNTSDFKTLKKKLNKICYSNFINPDKIEKLYIVGFDNAVGNFLNDGILSTDEEEKIKKFQEYFKFDQEIIDKNGSLQKVAKALILRDVVEGKIPENRQEIIGHMPFNLQKSEKIIWTFSNVKYYEKRTKTTYSGGYSGVGIRVARGVYYRTGGFKGHPVQEEEMKYFGNGIMAMTNKHIYFASANKNLRVQYGKIITIEPYENGIGIQKDGVTAKPQFFMGIDVWFCHNLISNLSQL